MANLERTIKNVDVSNYYKSKYNTTINFECETDDLKYKGEDIVMISIYVDPFKIHKLNFEGAKNIKFSQLSNGQLFAMVYVDKDFLIKEITGM
jgi:hypothetical protein